MFLGNTAFQTALTPSFSRSSRPFSMFDEFCNLSVTDLFADSIVAVSVPVETTE